MDTMQQGLERCPFLREVAQREGQGFAAHIACRPTVPYARSAEPVLREDACDFAATFQLFHGPAGVVPLRAACLPAGAGCPFHLAKGTQSGTRTFATAASPAAVRPQPRAPAQQLSPFAGTPMASLSLSFGLPSGLGDWWAQRSPRRRQQRRQCRQQGPGQPSNGSAGGANSTGGASRTGAGSTNGAQARARFGSGRLQRSGRFRSGKFSNSTLAKQLGGLLALGAQQELKCPAAVVAARAAIARLKPVRVLRPKALPVKLLAIGAFTGVANAPSGAAREHTRKFSPAWFLAVHATIPFIAMLRKAVVMPKRAMAWTIACAVIGQLIGSRLERARLQQQHGQLPAAPSSHPAAAAKGRVAGGGDVASAPARTCCQSAAALQLRAESAWRQSYFVPAVC